MGLNLVVLIMAIGEEGQEMEDNLVLDEGLSTQAIDPKFLADLERSQGEFEGWLEKIRERGEKSISLLEEVREDLGRSQSWLNKLQGKEEKSDRQDKSYTDKSKR